MEQSVISPPTHSLPWTKTADDIICPDSTSLSLSPTSKSWVPPPSAHPLCDSPTSSVFLIISFFLFFVCVFQNLTLCLPSLLRHLPQQHYDLIGAPFGTTALAVRGQHPPIVGGLPAGAGSPVQRPALPTGHGGGGVDAHAPPIRLREDQVRWKICIFPPHGYKPSCCSLHPAGMDEKTSAVHCSTTFMK